MTDPDRARRSEGPAGIASEEKGRRDTTLAEEDEDEVVGGGGRVLPSHFREDFSALDGGRLAWRAGEREREERETAKEESRSERDRLARSRSGASGRDRDAKGRSTEPTRLSGYAVCRQATLLHIASIFLSRVPVPSVASVRWLSPVPCPLSLAPLSRVLAVSLDPTARAVRVQSFSPPLSLSLVCALAQIGRAHV